MSDRDKGLFDLTGQKALVTGAGRGLGEAIALRLAQAGADVGLIARSEGQIKSVAARIEALGRRAACLPLDLAQVEAIPEAVERVTRELDGLDILVNNAGVNIPQKSEDVTVAAWDQVLNLNLRSAFFTAQAAGRIMIRRAQGGRIINITSQTGSVALIKRAAYCASKAGLNLVTKVLALEWGPHGILVNAVAPTFIETEMTRPMLADPEFRAYALAKNVLKRFGTPDDVAAAVLYLASPASSMVTGHVLLVDAGWTAH